MDKDLTYMEEKYQTTQWDGHTWELDHVIAVIALFQPNSNKGMSVFLDKEGAAIIGKWLMEFAESKEPTQKTTVVDLRKDKGSSEWPFPQ